MPITDSEDAPTTVTTELAPDWSQGVSNFVKYRTQMQQARSGVEQRRALRNHGKRVQEYFIDGMTQAETENLLEQLDTRSSGAFLIAWWAEGLRLSITMATVNTAQVETEPLADWAGVGDTILIGDETREISAISGRVLTLVAKSGATQKAADTWVYPMRLAVFDRPDETLTLIRHDAARQAIRFVEL
jgi:hypothetical protein